MSFAFAQTDANKVEKQKYDPRKEQAQLKKNVAVAVDYFTKSLKLDPKQRSMFSTSFTNYINDVYTARKKAESKKDYNTYVMRFATRRNGAIEGCLNAKKFKKYNELIKHFDPNTLVQKKGKDPRKK